MIPEPIQNVLQNNVKPFYVNKRGVLLNDDVLSGLSSLKDNSVDLIVTSPPYNCGIQYDKWDDSMLADDYFDWCGMWLYKAYTKLKPTGRICVNVLIDISMENKSVRVSPFCEIYNIMKEIGYDFAGFPIWTEGHRVKYSAWGSWKSSSAPYIYTPCEVIMIGYKEKWQKPKGDDTISKEQFLEGVKGMWKFRAQTHQLTKANFPLDLPSLCIHLLSYKGEVVVDPFMGSGTTAIAAIDAKRNYIGIDISEEYCKVAIQRIQDHTSQLTLFGEDEDEDIPDLSG